MIPVGRSRVYDLSLTKLKNRAPLSPAMRSQHMAILGFVIVGLLTVPQPALSTFGAVGPSQGGPHSLLSWTRLKSIDVAPENARRLGPLNGTIDVTLALQSGNPQGLSLFLREVSTPGSPLFDHFLTLKEFDQRFGSDASARGAVIQYLRNQSLTITEVYPGGLVIDARGSAVAVGKTFHTEINMYHLQDGRTVYAASAAPSIPSRLAGEVSGVSGLSNLVKLQPYWAWGQNTYQQGVQQQFFAPDLQGPNGLPSVYNSTASHVYGKGETIATVLWDGQRCSAYATNGTCSTWAGPSGPFDPATVSAYWKSYIPSWEPQPSVAGVPVDGAVAPGSGADYDATQAYVESTLDVEMAGSMAPGANITEVYTTCDPSSKGPQGPTIAQIDDAFTTAVTNPNKVPSLNNVTVISNSWGAPEYENNLPGGGYVFDAAWRNTLEQALATGITVLSSSGDSGNNSVNWPADIGNNTYGMVSVGGVTLNVTGTPATQKLTSACILGGLQCIPGIDTLPQSNAGSTVKAINYQDAWWFPAGTLNGQSYSSGGTTGGPSSYYKEPSWQSFALAGNSENPSPWRGDADIAGVANNTLIEVETCGLAGSSCTYLNSTDLVSIGGTSIASPEDAGVLAILSGALGHKLGFIDPELYSLGYNETLGRLATNPFIDVTLGKNSNYPAQKGWDYPTGWGTLNASALFKDWTSSPVSTEYLVTFTESGLPSGTSWSITLGTSTASSVSSTIVFSEPNGTYPFTVGSVMGYTSSPPSGSLTVNGVAQTIPITFTKSGPGTTYAVTFSESGLPSGTIWAVTLNGSTQSGSGNLVFTEPNGTYPFTVGIMNRYTPSPSSGGVTVIGAPVTQPITFTPVTTGKYSVTFVESGLPSKTSWSVTFNGSTQFSTTTIDVFTNDPNNTYPYSVGAVAGYIATPSSGSVTVNGANQTVSITFTPSAASTYAVTFSESGLPSGTSWSVTLNGAMKSGTGNIVFTEPNGTYGYAIGTVTGYTASSSSGNVSVIGLPISLSIAFTSILPGSYTVTFQESGLPSGTSWSVTMSGSTITSSTSSIAFGEPDGSYSFSVGSVAGYAASPPSGTITVSGVAVSTSITFTALPPGQYSLVFSETGLPTGTSWSVTVGTTTHSSTGSTMSFNEVNGTYSYTVGAVAGYQTTPSSGSVTVNGVAKTMSIAFTKASTGNTTSPSPGTGNQNSAFLGLPGYDGYFLLIVIAAVVVAIVVITLTRKKKAGAAPPPSSGYPGYPAYPGYPPQPPYPPGQ